MIPDSKRDWVAAYRQCELSDSLIEFALGEPADPLFSIDCERELLKYPFAYLSEVPGPPITPLWHITMTVVGCRSHGKAL